jgi:hypothetical protein
VPFSLLLMGHEPYSTLGWRIAESIKPQILNYGLLNERKYAKMYEDLKQLSLDSKSFVTYARACLALSGVDKNWLCEHEKSWQMEERLHDWSFMKRQAAE